MRLGVAFSVAKISSTHDIGETHLDGTLGGIFDWVIREHDVNLVFAIDKSSQFLIETVAESTEIFAPIFQLGCAIAWAGVTFSIS